MKSNHDVPQQAPPERIHELSDTQKERWKNAFQNSHGYSDEQAHTLVEGIAASGIPPVYVDDPKGFLDRIGTTPFEFLKMRQR